MLSNIDLDSPKIVRPSKDFKYEDIEKSFSFKSSAKIVNPLLTEHVGFAYKHALKGDICNSLTCQSCNSKSDKDTLKPDNIINKPTIYNVKNNIINKPTIYNVKNNIINKPTIYNVKKKKLRRQLLKLLGFLILLII